MELPGTRQTLAAQEFRVAEVSAFNFSSLTAEPMFPRPVAGFHRAAFFSS
jgi:hypothetical protein